MVRFLTQQNVDEFLHADDSKIGLHNKKIQDKFRAAGINPESALHYNKKREFTVGEDQANQKQQLDSTEKTLYGYLITELKKKIDKLLLKREEQKLKSQLSRILKSIAIIEKEITPEKQKWEHMKKIKEDCDDLLKAPFEQTELVGEFKEFAQHTIDQYGIIQKLKVSAVSAPALSSTPKKSETFVIEQWDKTRFETLFLANEVECCLAAGSFQFPAMLQRIMDDAMLFHVVTEKSSGKPVALSWLYFAETKDNKVYIVANFVEIKAKYGADEPSRKAIIDELLRFTGVQYCNANPNIAGFLINELGYGWNQGKLSDLPVKEIRLTDKVGGALLPSEMNEVDSSSRRTADTYFLASLNRPILTFHVYPSPQPLHGAVAASRGLFANTENVTNASQRKQQTDERSTPLKQIKF
jgi:hypothetical protein